MEGRYCFGRLEVSFQLQFAAWIAGVKSKCKETREEAGMIFQVSGGSDIDRQYREGVASENITEVESLGLSQLGFLRSMTKIRIQVQVLYLGIGGTVWEGGGKVGKGGSQ